MTEFASELQRAGHDCWVVPLSEKAWVKHYWCRKCGITFFQSASDNKYRLISPFERIETVVNLYNKGGTFGTLCKCKIVKEIISCNDAIVEQIIK